MSFCACTQANDTELAPTRSWRFGFSDGHSVVALSIFVKFVIYFTKHICYCQVVAKKILNIFVSVFLDFH